MEHFNRKFIRDEITIILKQIKDLDSKIQITPNTDFIKDLGFDSIDNYMLFSKLEQKFNLTIPSKDAEKLIHNLSLENLTTYIFSRQRNVSKAIEGKIEMVASNATSLQFCQNNTVLELNNPKVVPFLKILQEALLKQK